MSKVIIVGDSNENNILALKSLSEDVTMRYNIDHNAHIFSYKHEAYVADEHSDDLATRVFELWRYENDGFEESDDSRWEGAKYAIIILDITSQESIDGIQSHIDAVRKVCGDILIAIYSIKYAKAGKSDPNKDIYNDQDNIMYKECHSITHIFDEFIKTTDVIIEPCFPNQQLNFEGFSLGIAYGCCEDLDIWSKYSCPSIVIDESFWADLTDKPHDSMFKYLSFGGRWNNVSRVIDVDMVLFFAAFYTNTFLGTITMLAKLYTNGGEHEGALRKSLDRFLSMELKDVQTTIDKFKSSGTHYPFPMTQGEKISMRCRYVTMKEQLSNLITNHTCD